MNRLLLKTGLLCVLFIGISSQKSSGINTDSLKRVLPVVSQEKQIEILTAIVKATAVKNYDTAILYADKLLETATGNGNLNEIAKAHRYLGRIYNYYHKSDKAFPHLLKALELYRKLNDSITLISLSFDIGKYYYHDAKFDTANYYFLRTAKQCETLLQKKLPLKNQNKIKYTLQNIYLQLGNLNVEIEQFDPALQYYRSALQINREIGNKNGTAIILFSLGRYYMTIGETDSAEYYFRKNLQMRDEHKNPINFSTALIGLSHIYWKRKAYDSAYPLYVKALKLRRGAGDIYLTAFTLNNFGGLCDDMHRYEEADAYMKEADSLITVLNNKYLRQQHSLIQSDIYFKRGDYKKSLEYYKLYAAYKDSLVNENTNKKIAKLQTKYETEKKESKIRAQAVKLENQKRIIFLIVIIVLFFAIVLFLLFNRYRWKQKEKENNLKMARMETERRLLRVQMNPHFIFNSLNSIKGYILQKEPKTAALYLDKFAVLMRLTLEHSRQSWVPVEEDIKTLEIYLELEKIRYEDRFDFRIVIDENIDAPRTFIPPMLIQPFAENAVKHGFKNLGKRGELIITFERKNDLILCNVSDNGTGRAAASEKEHGSQDHKSLGVNLTDERLKLAFGNKNTHIRIKDLKSDDGKPAGTLVEIEIPFETD